MFHRRQPDEPRVLSFAQEGLWYLDQLASGSAAYNVAYRCTLQGPLDSAHFEQSIHAVIQRQEVLRTVFLVVGGKPAPFPLKKSKFRLQHVDLRNLPSGDRAPEASRLLHEEAVIPFQLARDSLFRATLYRLDADEYVFFHAAPHIVFEGGSVGVLYKDLTAFYNGAAPPPLEYDFADFARFQRENLTGERLDALNAFWRGQLEGLPHLDLVADYPRPAVHRMLGTREYFRMPAGLLEASHRFFREARTTSYRGLLAAFHVFLYCHSGLTDHCVGSPFRPLHPRCPALENVIGYFVNTVALRTRFTLQDTFRELVKNVDRVLWDSVTNSDLTFGKVVEAVQPPRDTSRTTLAQVNFRSPRQGYPAPALNGLTCGRAEYVDTGTSKFDLALEVEASAGEACFFEYCTDLFRPETITRMIADYRQIVAAVVAAPDTPLAQLIATGGWGAERRSR